MLCPSRSVYEYSMILERTFDGGKVKPTSCETRKQLFLSSLSMVFGYRILLSRSLAYSFYKCDFDPL